MNILVYNSCKRLLRSILEQHSCTWFLFPVVVLHLWAPIAVSHCGLPLASNPDSKHWLKQTLAPGNLCSQVKLETLAP